MQYYIKPKKREKGPYMKEQLVNMLGSLKIGRKTPCRPDDGSTKRRFPLEKVVSEARDTVLKEMRREADKMGAQALVGLDFKYNEISSGRSMLLMVGIGAAVTLTEDRAEDEA